MDPLTILAIIQTVCRGQRGSRGRSWLPGKGVLGMLGIKNLLALIGLVVVVAAGAGWYLGWYKIGELTDAQGLTEVKIQVNPAKVGQDINNLKKEIAEEFQSANGAVTPATGPLVVVPPPPPTAPPAVLPFPSATVPAPSSMWKEVDWIIPQGTNR